LLAAVTSRAIVVYATASGQEVRRFPTEVYSNTTQLIAFSPDGTMLAAAPDRGPKARTPVKLWDIETGREIRHFSLDATEN
jgi:WD40 repeat protein